jgi:general stress protein 26
VADLAVKTKFLEFVKSKYTAVIASVSYTGNPAAATIYFFMDEDLNIYFMTKKFARKFENLQNDHNVALVIGIDNEPATVQIEGIASQITEGEEFDLRMEQLQKKFFHNDFIAPLFQLSPDKNEIILYKITPKWIRWLDLRGENKNGDFVQIL